MIDQLSLSPALINALGWALVHALWQGALIAVLLAVALRFSRVSSDVRYGLACTALAAMLAAPAATFVVLASSAAPAADAGATMVTVGTPASPAAPIAVATRTLADDGATARVSARDVSSAAAPGALCSASFSITLIRSPAGRPRSACVKPALDYSTPQHGRQAHYCPPHSGCEVGLSR